MSKHTYIVKVAVPHPGAYNPDRPISDLVRNQILHMSLAERHLAKRHRSGVDIYSIKTERQASVYIHHLTKKLHPEGSRKPGVTKKAKSHRAKPSRKSSKANSRKK